MRIFAASDVPVGSHRAHAINVVKTAGGFARLGHDVTLLLRESDVSVADAARDYGEPGLSWRCAPATTRQGNAREKTFGEWVVEQAREADVLYARHFQAALAGAAAGIPTLLETHAYVDDENPLLDAAFEATARGVLVISTISTRLAAHYVERGADADRVSVIPDGVDVDLFSRPVNTGTDPMAPSTRPRVLYAGHLYDYKGVPTLMEAANLLDDASIHLLGGTDEDIARVRSATRNIPNMHVHGRVPHADVPRWLWHADVLVLPPSAQEPSCAWTSPVKLGEYLASGTPVVASSIPALRDWVDDSMVTWFKPDDQTSMADAIKRTLETPAGEVERRREAQRRAATTFSYLRRAESMLSALHRVESSSHS